MKKYYNTKEQFGWPGPFEANSKESLADEMLKTFNEWAEDSEDPESEIEQMRKSFIDGLEEVE